VSIQQSVLTPDGPQTNTSDKNLRPTFLDAPTHTSCFAGSNDPVAVGSNSSGGSLGQQWNNLEPETRRTNLMTCVCFGTDYPPSATAKNVWSPGLCDTEPVVVSVEDLTACGLALLDTICNKKHAETNGAALIQHYMANWYKLLKHPINSMMSCPFPLYHHTKDLLMSLLRSDWINVFHISILRIDIKASKFIVDTGTTLAILQKWSVTLETSTHGWCFKIVPRNDYITWIFKVVTLLCIQ